MKRAFYAAPKPGREPILLIFLPGLNMRYEDFAAQGFVDAAQREVETLDVLALEPDLDLYLDGAVADVLVAVIREYRMCAYARIWFAGISLGAYGALLTASADPGAVEGIILLAPFLGTPGLVAEVERAGGLASWAPGPVAANDAERRVLAWLQRYTCEGRNRPILRLAYGHSDRFAAASSLLAACLPADAVCVVDGAHDWPTWASCWTRILAGRPFAAPPAIRA